jgi:hypothetical protein
VNSFFCYFVLIRSKYFSHFSRLVMPLRPP